jgi:hypothetical protein
VSQLLVSADLIFLNSLRINFWRYWFYGSGHVVYVIKFANTQDNNEDDIADDPNIETAISIKNSLHNIMRMTKQHLQQNISNFQETVDVLRQHTVF